uniref:Uncharacterized protein n=1 Tax=Spongospora subterranea TaxID=70186 RepID=A0A0H5QME0_9EUKA|eukprot:CRZ03285.1 hypothetical protein [Spongospora subterranea]
MGSKDWSSREDLLLRILKESSADTSMSMSFAMAVKVQILSFQKRTVFSSSDARSVALEDQLLLSRLVSLLVLDVGKLGPDTAWGLLFGQFLLIIEYVGVLYVLLCV